MQVSDSRVMSANPDDKTALGSLGRQEILTFLMIAIFGGFVFIVYTIIYLILSNPNVLQDIVITGAIDLGVFVERYDEILVAFLVLLGVGVGARAAKK